MGLYDKYLSLKRQNPKKLYLFKSGNFYIFLGKDVDTINKYCVLKKTKFSNESLKCGFPVKSKDEYMQVFNNLGLDIEIVKNETKEDYMKIINEIKKINLENITPIESFEILKNIKEKLE